MTHRLAALLVAALPLAAFAATPATPDSTSAAPSTWETGPIKFLPRAFDPNARIDVIVFTEMSKDGKALPPPSPAHPTYVLITDSGQRNEGDTVGGERAPKPEALKNAMTRALAINGYLPSDAAHPPTQIVSYMWGSFNKLTFTGEDDDLEVQNLATRAALVGGLKFAGDFLKAYELGGQMFQAFKMKDRHTEWLCDRAMDDLYFIMATSYDYVSAGQGVKKPLWQTKMTTSSQGITMDESVPTLVANSGAFFGKETNGAARMNRPAIKDGQVEIGTPVEVDSGPGTAARPAPVPGK